ncbi:hypothetical protein Tco_1235488 [Tanacetum coccineum]
MIQMPQNIDREDLKTLWKLVKAKHGNTKPTKAYERVLLGDQKVMFEPDIESEVLRDLQGHKVTIQKMNIKFRGGLLGLKDFKMILRVTTAQITTAWKSFYCHMDRDKRKDWRTRILTKINYTRMELDFAADGNLRELNGEEAWEAIENFAQGQKEWDNPPNIISEQEVANLKAQAKILFGNENVWVEMHRGIAWDKVENLNPQSTLQVLLLFKEYTPPVTYPEEVEETIRIPMEVEPLDHTKLEDLGLNTCIHDLFLNYREIPNFEEPEPQPQPLPSCPSLDISLRE